MYLAGVLNRPDTFACYSDEKRFLARIKKLSEKKLLSWFLHIPDVSRVWMVGIKGRMDTMQIFTTEQEVTDARHKLSRFYAPGEIYLISFGDEANDA